MNEENKNIYISYWLLLITGLVGVMIIVGGLTRLTDSGLSITKWELFTGILPPLNTSEWENAFNLYKEIPEYKLLNSLMTLDEFKAIYWWEYIHRLLGRIVGFLYFLPLLYFTFKKYIPKKKLLIFYFILILIMIQGFIGWYMVQSGLSERTDVSHYRLSLHLTLAFIIMMLLFWNFLIYIDKNKITADKKISNFIIFPYVFCLILQISLGALVSGLDAGQIYQTWPLMGQNYFPDDSNINDLFNLSSLENPSIVQFIHRNVAYFILLLFIFILYKVFLNKNFFHLKKVASIVLILLLLQIFLGILTVLYGAPLILASIHQVSSIFLIISSLVLLYENSRIN